MGLAEAEDEHAQLMPMSTHSQPKPASWSDDADILEMMELLVGCKLPRVPVAVLLAFVAVCIVCVLCNILLGWPLAGLLLGLAIYAYAGK